MTPVPSQVQSSDTAEQRPSILVLGTAEWNSYIATNQHYVVRELAQDHETFFVESLGLRRVRLDARDVGRMANRVRKAILDGPKANYRPIPDRARIISPIVIPLHRRHTRIPNKLLLHRAVTEWRRRPRPRILWTFTPVTYDLECYADVTLYHCVDILHAFPGIDSTAIAAGEANLSRRAQLAIATSEVVADHLQGVGFSKILTLPNVADVEIFTSAKRPAAERRPAALFAGNLTPHKLDFELLKSLAAALQGRGEMLLAGPVAAGGGEFDKELAELKRLGAKYLGVLTLDQLAEIAGKCTVGLIPYALNEYTKGVSPLKCYEYLAAGLDVVSTAVPDVLRAARGNDFIGVAHSVDAFLARVLKSLAPGPESVIQARADFAAAFGWGPRGDLLRHLLAKSITEAPDLTPASIGAWRDHRG